MLRGPSPQAARWKGLLVCAVDGTIMTVADSLANLAIYSKQRGGPTGGGSYPTLRLLALVACGTRTVIDAVSAPSATARPPAPRPCSPACTPGWSCSPTGTSARASWPLRSPKTRADFLIRVRTGTSAPKLPVLRRLPDGTWMSAFGGVPVRVIDAEITVTTTAGITIGRWRLITTLADPGRYPAAEVIALYHERWEIETCYFELKSTILGGRVLRARTPDGIEQEVWALLVTYQALRTAIADATATVPGTGPDRASFTIALNTARDQVILAAGVTPDPTTDLAGTIGRTVLAALLPPRRLRTSPRVVKRAISKYNARGKTDRTTRKATIGIALLTAP